MIFVARKMNIPTMRHSVLETFSEDSPLASPVTSDELFQQFTDLQQRTKCFLIYSSDMSAKALESSISKSGKEKFDAMLGILDVFGKVIAACDALLLKMDKTKNKDLYESVYAYSVKLEQNLNILITYFTSLSYDKKLNWLGIDEEIVTMDEIAQQKIKVSNLECFPQKERHCLNEALNSLAAQLDGTYEKLMENSTGTLLIGAIFIVVIIYGIAALIAYVLWGWMKYVILLGYLWFVVKRVKQFQSIAKSRREESNIVKIILAALGNPPSK